MNDDMLTVLFRCAPLFVPLGMIVWWTVIHLAPWRKRPRDRQ